jgi:hypothetical protein
MPPPLQLLLPLLSRTCIPCSSCTDLNLVFPALQATDAARHAARKLQLKRKATNSSMAAAVVVW